MYDKTAQCCRKLHVLRCSFQSFYWKSLIVSKREIKINTKVNTDTLKK